MSRLVETSSMQKLRRARPAILPSLLLCDFANLEREVRQLEEAGVECLHLDVMDGAFVPNFTYGMPIVAALSRVTNLPLDVHLMIQDPAKYSKEFIEAGADCITFHIESMPEDPERVIVLLESIKKRGVGAGVALNPETPLTTIDPVLDWCDLVLVMSVKAGFGGQSFNPIALDKLRALRHRLPEDVLLEVDGGINLETIGECRLAGADLFVVGSAIFKQPDYQVAVKELETCARMASQV